MAIKIELGPTSATAIDLKVNYASIHGKKQLSSQHRTLAGSLYVYTWSTYIKHIFNVNHMSTSNASIVNSWWENNTELLLFITSDSNTEISSVIITNKDKPVNKFEKPYYTFQKGSIKLESY